MSGRPRSWLLAFLLGASALVMSLGNNLTYYALLFRLQQSSPELRPFTATVPQALQVASTAGYVTGVVLAGLAIRRLRQKTLFLASFTAAGLGALLVFFSAFGSASVAVVGAGVLGAAQGAFFPVSVTLLAEAHPVGRRALSLLVLVCGVLLGQVASPPLAEAAVHHSAEWRLTFLFVATAVFLFGIALYWILFSGITLIAPESEPDAGAWSSRNWIPGPPLTGCLLGGTVAVLAGSLWTTGMRSLAAELVQRSGAYTKVSMFEGAQSLGTLLALVAGIIYGDRLSVKSSKGHIVFLLPAMAVGPVLAQYFGSLQAAWALDLAAVGYGGVVGLFHANLYAAVLDVTPKRNWAKGIALVTALQSVAPVLASYTHSWPWLLTVSGWMVCLYMAWAMRKWIPIPARIVG